MILNTQIKSTRNLLSRFRHMLFFYLCIWNINTHELYIIGNVAHKGFQGARAKYIQQKIASSRDRTQDQSSVSSLLCLADCAKQKCVGQYIFTGNLVSQCFISRINKALVFKGLKDSDWQLNVYWGKSGSCYSDDQQVLSSNPPWAHFFIQFILLYLCKPTWQHCQLCVKTRIILVFHDTHFCQIIWQI